MKVTSNSSASTQRCQIVEFELKNSCSEVGNDFVWWFWIVTFIHSTNTYSAVLYKPQLWLQNPREHNTGNLSPGCCFYCWTRTSGPAAAAVQLWTSVSSPAKWKIQMLLFMPHIPQCSTGQSSFSLCSEIPWKLWHWEAGGELKKDGGESGFARTLYLVIIFLWHPLELYSLGFLNEYP